ncbi:MAG: Cysteine desulfurase IscS [Chlamydiales bacterium]|nr:Cysteine desulfurase IscS [Chlamydiales bacterium]
MIYLDNNATTLLDPEVLAAMQNVMHVFIGNPSSIHRSGQKARALLVQATQLIAQYFGVQSEEVFFTSGATEALNMLIRGIPKKGHIVSSSLEHHAVIESLKVSGCEVTYLDPERGKGALNATLIEQSLRPNTELIVVTAVNSETGIVTDLTSIAKLAERIQVPLLVDGVAWLGKAPVQIPSGVSAICFSGHKVHGPLGVGVAIIRRSLRCNPLIVGGPQQRGLRAGTENIPAIVGFQKALEQIDESKFSHMERLRLYFEQKLQTQCTDLIIHGQNEPRICNTSNISFLGVDGETLVMQLDLAGLCASHGSACSSGSLEPSRILLSMGVEPSVARSSIRFSLSRLTTLEEVDQSIELISSVVNQLRKL